MSEKHIEIVPRPLSGLFKSAGNFVQTDNAGARGHVSPGHRPYRAELSQLLFIFSFSTRLRKIHRKL
jgi:hypothetical protein